jgi:exoribonuclease-2
MQRGDKVRVQLGNMDTMALDVNGTVIEKIENTDTALDANEVNLDDALDELEETVTGPIALAMNVDEAAIEEPSSS